MLSIILAIGLFLHFILIGRAFLCLIRFRGPSFLSWVLAPAIGVSIKITFVGILNQLGWPVLAFARNDLIISSALCIIILAWAKPRLSLKTHGVFISIILISFFAIGWPALLTGFNWLSYSNDDMANYCLAALRHINNGFYRVPTMEELQGRDYSQFYWFMHVGALMRYGSEVLMAWVGAMSGKNPINVFMPTMLALTGVTLTATAALARSSGLKYRAIVHSCIILVMSPLFILGIYCQLIAQIAGIALAFTLAAILLNSRYATTAPNIIKYGLACGLLSAGLCVTYPEITPFVGLPILGFPVMYFLKFKKVPVGWFGVIGVTGIIALVLLRENIGVYIFTILAQAAGGTKSAIIEDILFPYFLLPTGLSAFAGFTPINAFPSEPKATLLFILGFSFAAIIGVLIMRDLLKFRSYSLIGVTMILMGVYLFINLSDFGLFKLAMFIQPVIAIAIAIALNSPKKTKWICAGLIVVLLQSPTWYYYGDRSLGATPGGLTGIPDISQHNIEVKPADKTGPIYSDITHVVAAKFSATEMIGNEITFISRRYFMNIFIGAQIAFIDKFKEIIKYHPNWVQIKTATSLFNEFVLLNYSQINFNGTTAFTAKSAIELRRKLLYTESPYELFNNWNKAAEDAPEAIPSFLKIIDPAKLKPRLSFISSNKGEHYYLPEKRQNIAFHQAEEDYYRKGHYFSSMGRFFLFEITNYTEPVYFRISFSRSLLGRNNTELPQNAFLQGISKYKLPTVGAGAANLIIGPIQPQIKEGHSLLSLDFGQKGVVFGNNKNGILKLYNMEVPIDPRSALGFGRDMSILSKSEYEQIQRPSEISSFPDDITRKQNLEYSGWFEDGWISKKSYVILRTPKLGESLSVNGIIPGIDKFMKTPQELEIIINGEIVSKQTLRFGLFNLSIPIPRKLINDKFLKVELGFSGELLLPGGDARPVAAQITHLGLK
jgi:hypothetical protein